MDCFGANMQTGITFRKARGTAAAPTAVQLGDTIMQLQGRGYGATLYPVAGAASIRFLADQAFTDTAMGGSIAFYTTLNGTLTLTQRLIIKNDGDIVPSADGTQSFGTAAARWGSIYSVTPATADNSTLVATTGFVKAQAYAPLASPALTGSPTAPTQAANDNSTKIATTAFVQTELADMIAAAPATLDTLNELAAALGDDPNFASTMATSLGLKAPLASPALTGNPTAPTPATADNDTSIATTAYVQANCLLQVTKAGDTMTGGLGFGSSTVATNTDCTRHIQLHATANYGFGVSASRLNYNVGSTGSHRFLVNAVEKVAILSTGLELDASPTPGDNSLKVATTAFVNTPNVQSVVSAATVTAVAGNDMVKVTAQAAALALANPTGAWLEGQGFVYRIKDNGTARAITYGTNLRAMGVTRPTTTVAGKTLYLGVVYNATDAKWDVVSVIQEA
jgi:hypothetical protein